MTATIEYLTPYNQFGRIVLKDTTEQETTATVVEMERDFGCRVLKVDKE